MVIKWLHHFLHLREGRTEVITTQTPCYTKRAPTLLSAMTTASTLWAVPVLFPCQTSTKRGCFHQSACNDMSNTHANCKLWGSNQGSPSVQSLGHFGETEVMATILNTYIVHSVEISSWGITSGRTLGSWDCCHFSMGKQCCSLNPWISCLPPQEMVKAEQRSSFCAHRFQWSSFSQLQPEQSDFFLVFFVSNWNRWQFNLSVLISICIVFCSEKVVLFWQTRRKKKS